MSLHPFFSPPATTQLLRRATSGFPNKVCNFLYWFTLILARGLMQPFLVYVFYELVWFTKECSVLDFTIVMASQLFLCCFNVALVYLHLKPTPPKESKKKE